MTTAPADRAARVATPSRATRRACACVCDACGACGCHAAVDARMATSEARRDGDDDDGGCELTSILHFLVFLNSLSLSVLCSMCVVCVCLDGVALSRRVYLIAHWSTR